MQGETGAITKQLAKSMSEKPRQKATRRVRTISLFSGCGGSDLALKSLGYDVVWANDISEIACKTYNDNIGPVVECGDIENFGQFPDAEFLVGCYPCQGFTQGGRRDAGDLINYLYQQFDRVLRIVSPKAFVVENVNGMAFGENRQLLNNQICRYRMAGYRVNWRVLDAQHYGVAQMRRRVFIVGVRSDLDFEYVFPAALYGAERNEAGQPEGRAGWPARVARRGIQ